MGFKVDSNDTPILDNYKFHKCYYDFNKNNLVIPSDNLPLIISKPIFNYTYTTKMLCGYDFINTPVTFNPSIPISDLVNDVFLTELDVLNLIDKLRDNLDDPDSLNLLLNIFIEGKHFVVCGE